VQQVTGGVAVVSASNLPPGRQLRPIHPGRENFIVAACCTALHPWGEIVARPDRTFSDFFGRRARRNGAPKRADLLKPDNFGLRRTSSDIANHDSTGRPAIRAFRPLTLPRGCCAKMITIAQHPGANSRKRQQKCMKKFFSTRIFTRHPVARL